MIRVTVKMPAQLRQQRGGLGPGSDELFRRAQIQRLGYVGRDSVVARTRKGLGSDDNPMPPLSVKTSAVRNQGKVVRIRSGYAGWKAARGLAGFRDLYGTGKQGGHMLDNFTVRPPGKNADGTSEVKIAFTQRHQREKALANERRSSFLQWSPSNVQDVMRVAARMFHDEIRASVSDVSKLLAKFRRRAA